MKSKKIGEDAFALSCQNLWMLHSQTTFHFCTNNQFKKEAAGKCTECACCYRDVSKHQPFYSFESQTAVSIITNFPLVSCRLSFVLQSLC